MEHGAASELPSLYDRQRSDEGTVGLAAVSEAASVGEDLDTVLDEVLLGLPDLSLPELVATGPTEGFSPTAADSGPQLDFPDLLPVGLEVPPIHEKSSELVEEVGAKSSLIDGELAVLPPKDRTYQHLQSGDAAEQRRAKARRKSKRLYDKAKEKMAALRVQVTELEERLRQVMLTTGNTRSSGQLEEARLLRAQLQEENMHLRQLFKRSIERLTYLRDVLCAEHKLYVITASQFLVLKPLTPRDCFEVYEGAMETVGKFNDSMQHVSSTGTMCGWNRIHTLKRQCFNFAMRKTFRQQTAGVLGDMTWRVLSDPKRINIMHLHSDGIAMEIRLVQVVDSDNLVFFHRLETIDADGKVTVTKSIMLMSRFKTPTSYRIQVVDLDNDRLVLETRGDGRAPPSSAVDGSEVWDKQFSWIQFDQWGDKHDECMASYARIIPFLNSNSHVWVAETMLIVMRWEAVVFGPKFTLPTE